MDSICAGPCSKRVLDPGETATDCGGPSCPACADGQTCSVGGDCQSGVCAVVCQAPTYTDGVKNGSEPATDCGVACPSQCADDAACNVAGDCQRGVCTLNNCQPATCSDGVENGCERDIDCYGASCSPCEVGEGCQQNGDCASNSCVNDVCACAADLQPLDDGSGANGAVGLPGDERDRSGRLHRALQHHEQPHRPRLEHAMLCSSVAYEQLATLAPT